MTQEGDHTWDLIIDYRRCPKCGYIIESRNGFEYRLGKWEKEVDCPRCGCSFTVAAARKPRFGPLIGSPQPREFDYERDG